MAVDMPLNRGTQRSLLRSASLLPFGDGFDNRAVVGNGWTGSTWSISSGKIINTPVLGSELIVNGGFAADTDWTKEDGWTIAAGVASKGVSSGNNHKISQNVLTVNKFYRCVYTVSNISGVVRPYFNASYPGGGAQSNGTFTSSMYSTGVTAGILGSATTDTMDVDNVSFREVPLAECFLVRDFGVAAVNASIAATVHRGNRCGVVLCLDNPANPQNFVIATHDGGPFDGQTGTVTITKCVGGTLSQVQASGGEDHVAGARIGLRREGTTFRLSYGGVDITSGVISDAGIISNTYHGIFSLHESSTLDDFYISAA